MAVEPVSPLTVSESGHRNKRRESQLGPKRASSHKSIREAAKQGSLVNIQEDQVKSKQNMTTYMLRKQIKVLLYKFVYQLLEEAISTYPFSFRLKYLAAYMQYYML